MDVRDLPANFVYPLGGGRSPRQESPRLGAQGKVYNNVGPAANGSSRGMYMPQYYEGHISIPAGDNFQSNDFHYTLRAQNYTAIRDPHLPADLHLFFDWTCRQIGGDFNRLSQAEIDKITEIAVMLMSEVQVIHDLKHSASGSNA